jgi:regulator of protease activity HflC (stomatin/prohibitin superfamily)
MKKSILICAALFVLTSCSYVGVNGDEEAVLIEKPLLFGHGGVDETPVSSGKIAVALTTEEVKFKIVPNAYAEAFENLISDDNVPLDFETHLTLVIRKGCTPTLYKNFGTGWYENNVSPKFRSMVRDIVSSYKMQELISSREVLSKIDEKLYTGIEAYCKKINLPIDIIQVTIGAATPPAEVLEETQKTAAQNQSILTQGARKNAEDARKDAEVSKALADQAYRQTMQMTMGEYLSLRALEIEKEKLEVARGSKNITVVMGQVQPMYNTK